MKGKDRDTFYHYPDSPSKWLFNQKDFPSVVPRQTGIGIQIQNEQANKLKRPDNSKQQLLFFFFALPLLFS